MTRGRRALKAVARFTDLLRGDRPGLVVLCYHRVGAGTGSEVDLAPAVFEEQLAVIAASGRLCRLEEGLDRLGGSGPADGVVVTFDDGTADFADHAVPALVAAGLPATLYAATHFVDTGTTFPWGTPPASWQSLRDAAGTGLVTIGSHTHSHWLLDRTDHAAVTDDLDRSISLIAEHIGTAPQHFAYPKAVLGSPATEAAVRARFASAALARNRPNRPGAADLHRLWRTPVQRSDAPQHFAAKAGGGMRLEGSLRDLAARWKYRGQTQ